MPPVLIVKALPKDSNSKHTALTLMDQSSNTSTMSYFTHSNLKRKTRIVRRDQKLAPYHHTIIKQEL